MCRHLLLYCCMLLSLAPSQISAQVSEAADRDRQGMTEIERHSVSFAWQKRMIEQEDYYLSINSPYLDTNEQTSNYSHLLMQTGYSVIAGVGAMVYLWNQPTSFTNWDKREETDFMSRYRANISRKPRFDDDDFVTNYIGHPLAGATYYVMARQNALVWYNAFFYSVFMSTFYWEYGLEAFAEVPSSQDLVITPLVGSIIGELVHQAKQSIKRSNNSLAGSKNLGRIAMWVLDPLGHFTSGIHYSLLSDSKLYLAPDFVSESSEVVGDRKLVPRKKMGVKLVFSANI